MSKPDFKFVNFSDDGEVDEVLEYLEKFINHQEELEDTPFFVSIEETERNRGAVREAGVAYKNGYTPSNAKKFDHDWKYDEKRKTICDDLLFLKDTLYDFNDGDEGFYPWLWKNYESFDFDIERLNPVVDF